MALNEFMTSLLSGLRGADLTVNIVQDNAAGRKMTTHVYPEDQDSSKSSTNSIADDLSRWDSIPVLRCRDGEPIVPPRIPRRKTSRGVRGSMEADAEAEAMILPPKLPLRKLSGTEAPRRPCRSNSVNENDVQSSVLIDHKPQPNTMPSPCLVTSDERLSADQVKVSCESLVSLESFGDLTAMPSGKKSPLIKDSSPLNRRPSLTRANPATSNGIDDLLAKLALNYHVRSCDCDEDPEDEEPDLKAAGSKKRGLKLQENNRQMALSY